jgi:predicted kinase
MSRIVIVSGPPGAGKSTVARRLAETSQADRAVHLHTDDFYAYVRKGFVPPWKSEAQAQNITIMEALARAAGAYARDGYEVMVDGIVGPWFFDPWRAESRAHGLDLRYVALVPAEGETIARATARKTPGAMTDAAVVRTMWQAFQTYPPPPQNVLDTTGQTPAETTAAIRSGLAAGEFRLA